MLMLWAPVRRFKLADVALLMLRERKRLPRHLERKVFFFFSSCPSCLDLRQPSIGRGEEAPTPTLSISLRKPQRAQRSNKFDLDRNVQSRSKFLISLENFNIDISISPQKIGPRWVTRSWLARRFHSRSKFSISIEISNFFDLWSLWDGPFY